jgi:hypothetical protein
MIWAILVLLGVPLWLVASGILVLLLRARQLRHRPANVGVRVHDPDKAPAKGWKKGNALWVRDVFAFRGWPAAWSETLAGVSAATSRAPTDVEAHALRHLDAPVIAVLTLDDGEVLEVAAAGESLELLLGPYAESAASEGVS